MAEANNGFFTSAATPSPGAKSGVASRDELSFQNKEYGDAVDNTDEKAEALSDAKDNTAVKQKVADKANKDVSDTKKDIATSKQDIEDNEKSIDAAKDAKEASQDEADSQQELIDQNNEKISELKKNGDEDSLAEAEALKEQNKAATVKRDASLTDVEFQEESIKMDEEDNKELEKSIDDDEKKLNAQEDVADKANDNLDDAKGNESDAKDDLDVAKEEEADVMEAQAEEHPASFGKDVEGYKAQKAKDSAAIAKRQKEIDDKAADATAKAVAEEQAVKQAEIAAANLERANHIKALEKEIASGKLTGEEANKKVQELEDLKNLQKKIEGDKNKTLNEIIAAQLANAAKGGDHDTAYLHFDAPNVRGLEGKLEDIISDKMQPMYKHAFIGEFPDKLKDLDWLVKGMDRPKVDIEYVEQVRANVKRQYPVKYNYGDLSLTFLDDVHHKTIMTIYQYFTGHIWSHDSIKARGTLLLRDETVIPEIIIYDLTDTDDEHRKYTYQNVSMLSFDYDSYDDYEDGGVHSIQVVFKIEGFKLELAQSPRSLNLANDPIWF